MKRRHSIAIILVIVAVVVWQAIVRTTKSQTLEIVRAQRFELVDANGKIRGVMGLKQDTAFLALFDNKVRKSFVAIGASADGIPNLTMADKTGNVRISLVAADRTHLSMADKDGKLLIQLDLDPNGSTRLRMFDKEGKPRTMLSDSGLSLANKEGKLSTILFTTPLGGSRLSLLDKEGKQRTVVATLSDGTSVLRLYNKEGKVIWEAP